MVTINNIVESVGTFKGDTTTERRNYERAKQGIPVLKEAKEALEDTLKLWTGYDGWNLPSEVVTQEITRGEVTFTVKSHATTKKPSYMTAATEIENYLIALNNFAQRNEARPGLLMEAKRAYVSIDTLLERAEEIVEGIMVPGVDHEIRYRAPEGAIVVPKSVTIEERTRRLSARDFTEYVAMDALQEELETFKKAYEKQFKKENKGQKVAAVTTRTGYKQESVKAEGVNWAYVVKTLMGTRDEPSGEFQTLADPDTSLAEKEREMPYKLLYRESGGVRRLYVGIQSVYDRIQQLKGEETISAKRERLVLTEVV